MVSEQPKNWYVLKAMFGRALQAQRMLIDREITSYVPMEYRDVVVKGQRKVRKLVPVISNLIFVETTFEQLYELKLSNRYLWYLTRRGEGGDEPIVVEPEEMERFREFVEGRYDELRYLDIESFDLKKGERVRIIDGAFAGREGTFVKVKGRRSRQIVVAIDGLLAVEIVHPNPAQIIERI